MIQVLHILIRQVSFKPIKISYDQIIILPRVHIVGRWSYHTSDCPTHPLLGGVIAADQRPRSPLLPVPVPAPASASAPVLVLVQPHARRAFHSVQPRRMDHYPSEGYVEIP